MEVMEWEGMGMIIMAGGLWLYFMTTGAKLDIFQ